MRPLDLSVESHLTPWPANPASKPEFYDGSWHTHSGQKFQPITEAIPELAPFYFDWELSFDVGPWINFLQNNYWLPFAVCTLYFVLVFGGKALMANKKPFDLQGPLALWNVGLSVFSIMGALRLVPQVLYYWKTQGFDFLICGHPEQVLYTGPTAFWMMAFVLSKFPELVDTAFIVLRKKKLMFLHWFHHITVLLICWDAIGSGTAAGILFAAMNYCVHSIMYAYYSGYLPFAGFFAPIITTMQILQMVLGTSISLRGGYLKLVEKQTCSMSDLSLVNFSSLYAIYLYLFVAFAVQRYCLGGGKKRAPKSDKTAEQKKTE